MAVPSPKAFPGTGAGIVAADLNGDGTRPGRGNGTLPVAYPAGLAPMCWPLLTLTEMARATWQWGYRPRPRWNSLQWGTLTQPAASYRPEALFVVAADFNYSVGGRKGRLPLDARFFAGSPPFSLAVADYRRADQHYT